ncbi:MAG: recombination protein RecR [Clostridia bacterium]|nr:recombination protein RecR [Oscillospiraceae bacterium]MBR4893372.1 recombination protein RecR [Clostridia bacterium]
MNYFVAPLAKLIDEFNKLPGIGKKSAQRLAFYILSKDFSYVKNFSDALIEVKEKVNFCEKCFNVTDKAVCDICHDPKRNQNVICVVENPKDVIAMENLNEFNGVYHVLHGVISPLNEIGPDDIKIKELVEKVAKGNIEEVILATNLNVEGETTAMYIAKLLSNFVSNITRLANGLPVGSDIEYADESTLLNAFEGRRKV